MASQLYVAPGIRAVRREWSRSGADAHFDLREQLDDMQKCSVVPRRKMRAVCSCRVGGSTVLLEEPVTLDAMRQIVVCDHGFASRPEVGGTVDRRFETAVDAVTLGELTTLLILLERDPYAVMVPAAHGHCATLLHYVAANGVEIRRQVVPANAPEIARGALWITALTCTMPCPCTETTTRRWD